MKTLQDNKDNTGMGRSLVSRDDRLKRAFERGSFEQDWAANEGLPEDASRAAGHPMAPTMPAQRGILLVEDNPDDVVLLRFALSRVGFTDPLIVAEDGRKAIDYLAGAVSAQGAQFALPRLVLLDLHMPQVSGLKVLQWIQSSPHLAPLPVVMLTSSCDSKDVEEARRLGARSYFVKPNDSGARLALAMILKDNWLTAEEPVPKGRHALQIPKNDFVIFARS
jgi:CheY-like chemotaxis protein